MTKGAQNINSKDYYFFDNGIQLRNALRRASNGYTYYYGLDGAMVKNAFVDFDVLGTLGHLTVTTEVIPVTVSVLNKFILNGLVITKEVNVLSTTLEDLSACDGTSVKKWCWQELAVG